MIFCPKEETLKNGTLRVHSASDRWDIDLVGVGREAVLIITNTSIDFVDCLIGNCYEQTIIIKNVGDVNYPVSFKLEKEDSDIDFIPQSLVMQPFSEGHVIVAFSPTKEQKRSTYLNVLSPYSSNRLPLNLHSGTAELSFECDVLDFGLFEMTCDPEMELIMTNVGSIKSSFFIQDLVKPSRFYIEPVKGIIHGQEQIPIRIKHQMHSISHFSDTITIQTDLLDTKYELTVKGQCEESLMRPEEFTNVSMGVCPVMEVTTKRIKFTNYGKFPISFEIKATYPLKVAPTTGVVDGEGTGFVNVIWTPSGAYELRTQLIMKTNIGLFTINVKGKSTFPELALEKDRLDFGVAAVGHEYSQTINLVNASKVPLFFNIPQLDSDEFTCDVVKGKLEAKESQPVSITFKPIKYKRYHAKIIVECRGVNFKEITVVGIGGFHSLRLESPRLNLQKISCHVHYTHFVPLNNLGELFLKPEFTVEYVKGDGLVSMVDCDDMLYPMTVVKYPFTIALNSIGEFEANILIHLYEEQNLKFNVKGLFSLVDFHSQQPELELTCQVIVAR